ncbi:MAG: hypothetical protein HKP48_00115 [Winogradskyella sp.]|uniref:esterase/lipase family protein n=1 Tax=Winogradskyella sp. TaxID=1883156 RepID=UPI0017A4D10F|nr:hypothetical protein [Winogradskyella sp.]MBT8246050.1 GPI inositol-deacylase [Winogradskyella sp.]NNK21720.1 hypothetical protein [Winogradskyella sp.]
MKKCTICIAILLFVNLCLSQTQNEIPEPDIDEMLFDALGRDEVSPVFLYERTTPIANLNNFNTENYNTASKAFFEQALQELYKASKSKKFISYKEARNYYFSSLTTKSQVKIGLLNATLYSINYDDINEENGAFEFKESRFIRINNKPSYTKKDVLVIAPLLTYAVGNSVTFSFENDLWFEDSENPIQSLSVDFGNGNSKVVYQNSRINTENLSVDYNTSGYKTIEFTATLKDGVKKTTFGQLHIKLPQASEALRNDPLVESVTNFVSTIPFQGYDETSPIYGELEYRIFYHTNNGNTQRRLLKPIIIIDGFDPEDKRKIHDSDSPRPAEEHTSIEEFMIYYDSQGVKQDLIEVLRSQGYDVILVNQPTYTRGTKTIDGGADYIERNARNHVSLYNHLNITLLANGSSEKLVIVGPSMGGQISRYALAYMEKNNIPHNTRLWVSIDSPHLGANIPIGIQSMINLLDAFGDSAAANDFYYNQLKSTAAEQQLIEQHKIGHLPDYLNGGSPVYQQYYSNLESNGLPGSDGYPQNLRKVAIVNGSLEGKKVGVEGEEDFRVHGFVDQLWWDVKVAEMNTKYMPEYGQNERVARLWRLFKPLRTASYKNNNQNGSLDVIPGRAKSYF